MKRMFKPYFLLLAGAFLLANCESGPTEESLQQNGENRVTFSLQAIGGEIEESGPSTRNEQETTGIRQLQYVILDQNEQIISPDFQVLSPDMSSLTLESLKDGDYSAVFFATTNPDKEIVQPVVENGELLLKNPSTTQPLDEDYLYKRIDFKVDKNNTSRTIQVELKRCVGRIEVEVNPVYPYTDYLIRKVEISLNDGSPVYTTRKSRNTAAFEGNGTITDYDITANRWFYTLPSQSPVSGHVTVESVRDDNTTVKNVYQFSNLAIEEGKIAKIQIDWKSPEGNKGFFRVHESDYTNDNTSLMLLDDEPREVFYDKTLRMFTTNKPLQVKVNSRQELQLNFYAPIAISDVTIWCRFKKYSSEFVKFAHYEKIAGFSESRMLIPLVNRPLTYASRDGRNVVIPAQPELKDEDCEFKVESAHPYMAKIATITSPLTVFFSPFAADQGHPYWRHMTPALCRHACVLAVNFSYMFNSEYYENKVRTWKGNPFKDGAGNIIPADEIISRSRRSTLVMGTVAGVGGLGGGATYGVAPYVYTNQYWDIQDGYSKMAAFHEFGHCMGYDHGTTMTYGDAWTELGKEMVNELGGKGLLPISNSNWDSNYP